MHELVMKMPAWRKNTLMNEQIIQQISADPIVEGLRDSRGRITVLKAKLILLRAHLPHMPVFAFEGDDDVSAYMQWIRQISVNYKFEPFPCNGKDGVLALKDIVDRDVSGLNRGIYYFVDRDFDDLRDTAPDDTIFMTCKYSIENYLVCEEVLDLILLSDFQCQARPDLRTALLRAFTRLYEKFLLGSAEINRRLFFARRAKIKLVKKLSDKISGFVNVSLQDVEHRQVDPKSIVILTREPTVEEASRFEADFLLLEPRNRFRGVFAFKFLVNWLGHLEQDRRAEHPVFFSGLPREVRINTAAFTVANFASKSSVPTGLKEFVDRVFGHA